ncbi:hypothetical protein CcaverHIS002_0305980 [Cutaneotrichosporon cavernicola]|uniref:FAD/NAD(P)-binding domain-containing protein n=1 Tax=Cutaneotrichosporon cavernicola TaxID=279322 RepID=A0AA48IGW4_9TREE|nr:uncharacterized protein CcaverHIS019_0305930 [Cutaneotrichosporon cavernicola]BEI82730.1 hypothetical protein CcaverHIS002_0305980 [Cutaneotrichosporon cavernicola]BEI90523.1 hypothetical protein CcaverHIS019_0305930 [Cutaneotrichosporon cavernicola]BEI98297.1 hypothetical protein CcaverHIS631_0305960 [Cutaneotrichosporon cavernicola]BEJ06072.1 hypothetical protein CcaverHIS641_0305940 [Cutaneotrichosporon cavernicola]
MTQDLAPAIPLPPLLRVAVVGAGGPSGLVAVAQLLAAGVEPSLILAFESRNKAGGVWNFDAEPGQQHVHWRKDGPPVVRSDAELAADGAIGPSAMYDRLRTNLPNQIMNYRFSPFAKDTPVFPTHQQVATYLQDYSKRHNLNDLIRWGVRVTSVYHTPGGGEADRWTVQTTEGTYTVSHVILANGHYNEPYLPSIPGLDAFTGQVVHARWWRNPRRFRGENVVVVGSRASGSDIARELAQDDESTDVPDGADGAGGSGSSARTIYQSVRGYKPGDKVWDDALPWTKRIHVVPEIVEIQPSPSGSVLVLENGQRLKGIKAIVFATGYLFSYPFATKAPFDEYPLTTSLAAAEDGLPAAGGQDILNLNNTDTFYVPDPTLALIGLHYQVNPFPLGEATARLIARSFTRGQVPPLPPLLRFTDRPGEVKIGAPAEFDNQDAWLRAIGEGGDEGTPECWPRSSEATREARVNALKMRKAELGY